jgi:hypothetical protein
VHAKEIEPVRCEGAVLLRSLIRNSSVIAVIGVAALSWAMIVGYRSSVPSADDWRRAVSYVKAERAVDDGLTWIPHFAEEGTQYFAGLNAFETPDADVPDFARYKRVWLLASHGDSPEFLSNGLKAKAVHREGPITIWRVENLGERVVADLYSDLENVVVQERNQQRCDFWSGKGWHCLVHAKRKRAQSCLKESTAKRLNRFRRKRSPNCGLSAWFHVSRDVRVIDRFARQCVWVHPRQRNEFVLDWKPSVTADELVVRYGFTDKVISMHSKPKPRTQTARLDITGLDAPTSIDVKPVQGWFEKRLPVNADRSAHAFTFAVTTSNPVDAHFCMDVTLRKRGR